MQFVALQFIHLTGRELFEIYKLRSAVFVVEQNCAYQDVDDKDILAHHLMLYDETQLVGYCRILPPTVSYNQPSIGRVCVAQARRKNGTGKLLMKKAINETLELFDNQDIVIFAQYYLFKFYTDLGFKQEGKEYLEDDISHVQMRYKSL